MLTASLRVALLAGALLPLSARADAPAAPPLLDEPAVAALALALSVSPTPELDVGTTPGGAAELEITATVEAAAVTFAEVPRIRVSLAGRGAQRLRWRTERSNLPEHVQPGVEYRDVTVRLALSGGPEQIQALLADARRIAAGIKLEEVGVAASAPAASAPATATPAPAATLAPAPAPSAVPVSTAVAAPTPLPAASAPASPVPASAPPVVAPAPAAAVPPAPAPAPAAAPPPPPAAADPATTR